MQRCDIFQLKFVCPWQKNKIANCQNINMSNDLRYESFTTNQFLNPNQNGCGRKARGNGKVS